MSDPDLRSLERAVADRGDVQDRVRLAAALDRAGREAEALRTLLAARDDPQVRGRVAAHPASWARRAWHLFDVPALRRAPRLVWSKGTFADDVDGVLATPLGVALAGHDRSYDDPPFSGGAPENHRTELLDPGTGSVRATVPGMAVLCAGDVVLTEGPDDAVVARDVVSGDLRWTCPATGRCHGTREGLLQWADRRADAVWLRESRDLLLPPGPPAVVAATVQHAPIVRVEACDDALLLTLGWGPEQSWALVERGSTTPRATGPGMGLCLDEGGFLVHRARDVVLHDRTGERRWAFPADTGWLAPGGRVAYARYGLSLSILDRETGAALRAPLSYGAHDVTVVRDGVYVRDDATLLALAEDGSELWRFPLEGLLGRPGAIPLSLAPLGDRVVGAIGRGGRSFCLGE